MWASVSCVTSAHDIWSREDGNNIIIIIFNDILMSYIRRCILTNFMATLLF